MAQDLSALRWQNRIVILRADSNENESLRQQIAILKSNKKGLEERKLVVFQNTEGKTTNIHNNNEAVNLSQYILKTLQSMSGDFKLLLIGLDGMVKLRSEKTVSVTELFDVIDAMPMRQAEQARDKY